MWDYIIIGAGSAGCALANRLTASGSNRVLVLEAGDIDSSLTIKIPAAEGRAAGLDGSPSKYDWGYKSEPDPSRHNKVDHWARGHVVGGSSSINGMIYVRGAASDYDRWAAMGNHGWAAKDVMPLFQALEHYDSDHSDSEHGDSENPMRGKTGPLYVRTVKNCHPLTNAFINASQTVQHRYNPDYNGTEQEGISPIQLTQRRGLRWSSADAFLKPALRKGKLNGKNLQLIPNALVHKLIVVEQRITGVCYEKDGKVQNVNAANVVLCAGAINSPKILMLSGIGDADALPSLGIEPVVDLPSVGKNLREHPLINLAYRTNIPSYNPTEGLLQKAGFLKKFLFEGQGPIASGFEAIGFLKTQADLSVPDIQIHMLPIGVAREGEEGPFILPFPSMMVYINKNHPKSCGEIRLASSDPKIAPLIECRLLENEEDVATLVRGIAMVNQIMKAAPMAELIAQEIRPDIDYSDPQALEDYVKNNTDLAYHPVGTCRMGVDDKAVVTPDLKVRGIDNLWVADASIMPGLISGNTNAVCMMIGEKLGRYLINRHA